MINSLFGDISSAITGGKHAGPGWLGSIIFDAINGSPSEQKSTIKLDINANGASVKVTDANTAANQTIDIDSGPLPVGG